MNRKELEHYIVKTYAAEAEFLWANHPSYAVFRHASNHKWFALIMDVPRERLGLPGCGSLDIVNVKCGPVLTGSFRGEPGIYPAYHMSKTSWISAALDGSVSGGKLKMLLDMSFDLTAPKVRKRGQKGGHTP